MTSCKIVNLVRNEFLVIYREIIAMKSGQRIKFYLPESYYDHENNEVDWEKLEEIQMEFRGRLPDDMFCTIKCEDDDEKYFLDVLRL